LVSKVKELEDKVKLFDEHNQKLLLFNGHITRLCLDYTKAVVISANEESKEVAKFFFRFNIHSFVAYFTKAFFYDTKYSPIVREDREWLANWNEHVQKILNPLFETEMEKIKEKFHPKSTQPSYIQ